VQHEIDVDPPPPGMVRADRIAPHPWALGFGYGGERLVPAQEISVRCREARHGLTRLREVQLHLLIRLGASEIGEISPAEGDTCHPRAEPLDSDDLDETDRKFCHLFLRKVAA
jgi:hypothetical protein